MLEKHASRDVLSFSKHFIDKGKNGASEIKTSTENLISMIYESFLLEYYFATFHFGISITLIVEIRNKIRKLLVSSVLVYFYKKQYVFQLSLGIKTIYRSKL